MGDVMTEQLKKFLQRNRDLINQNNKESWEEIYEKLPKQDNLRGEFTQTILDAGINDPAMIMGYIPKRYLYGSNIKNYKIPNSVTTIGSSAFYGCSSLTSVTIPDKVTKIGDYAFMFCSSLTSINIPDSVTTIGDDAFHECSKLTSIVIGEGVTTIGDGAFSWCSGLTSVVIPNSMTTIDRKAFYRCDNLKEITFKGTRKEATQSGLGYLNRKKWSEGSSVEKVICLDGVIEL